MQTNLVNATASDGYTMYGLSFTRKRPTANLMIFIHGAGNSNILAKQTMLSNLAKGLQRAAFDTVAFNNRGSGYVGKINAFNEDGTLKKAHLSGTAYELIAECRFDIEGMITWAIEAGYANIYLTGHSTGANKIVYFLNTKSRLIKHVRKIFLLAGGDDIGLHQATYTDLRKTAAHVRAKIAEGLGMELVGTNFTPEAQPFSFRALRELITEGSDYDIFPFGRYSNSPSLKLFRAYRSIPKSIETTCIYGSADFGTIIAPAEALEILQAMRPQTHIELIDDADHGFSGKEKQLTARITKYL